MDKVKVPLIFGFSFKGRYSRANFANAQVILQLLLIIKFYIIKFLIFEDNHSEAISKTFTLFFIELLFMPIIVWNARAIALRLHDFNISAKIIVLLFLLAHFLVSINYVVMMYSTSPDYFNIKPILNEAMEYYSGFLNFVYFLYRYYIIQIFIIILCFINGNKQENKYGEAPEQGRIYMGLLLIFIMIAPIVISKYI